MACITHDRGLTDDAATQGERAEPAEGSVLLMGQAPTSTKQQLLMSSSGSPKSSEASEPEAEEEDEGEAVVVSDDTSEEEVIEDYVDGGWSDEEDEETRKVREIKKALHGSAGTCMKEERVPFYFRSSSAFLVMQTQRRSCWPTCSSSCPSSRLAVGQTQQT